MTNVRTISCDHPDCTRTISYTPRSDGFKDSITQGWTLQAVGGDFCPWHKAGSDPHPTPWYLDDTDSDCSRIFDANRNVVAYLEHPGDFNVAVRIVDAVNKAAT